MQKETSSHTGLRPNVLDKETFEREIDLCKRLSRSGGCHWGLCKNCGVIPLLYKLHKGILLENPQEIQETRTTELYSGDIKE
jgi:hypothetical protein